MGHRTSEERVMRSGHGERRRQETRGCGRGKALLRAAVAGAAARLIEPLESRRLLSAAAVAPVGGEFRLNTSGDDMQTLPKLASDANGNFVAVWTDANHGVGLTAQRFDAAGNKVGTDFHPNTIASPLNHRVAMDDAGDFIVVWQSAAWPNVDYEVYAQRYAANGVPTGAQLRVNTTTTGAQRAPDVSMASDGRSVIAWYDTTGISFQRYDAAGTAVGVETSYVPADTGWSAPRVSLAPDGSFVIVWFNSTLFKTLGRRFAADGKPLGQEFLVFDRLTTEANIDTDAAGNFVVGAGFDNIAMVRQFAGDGTAKGPAKILTTASNVTHAPVSVSVAASGEFVVAYPAASSRIVLQEFDADGAPLTGEMQTNTNVTTAKGDPSVTVAGNGNVIVGWTSQLQDFESAGVYAQRYTPVPSPAVLGDRVWADANRNGVQDAGEPGVDGLTLDLFTEANLSAGRAISANGGEYHFLNLRPGDRYYVKAVLGSSFTGLTTADQGVDDALDSDLDGGTARSAVFTAGAAGSSDSTLDVGVIPTASISSYVWGDLDGDGVQDPGESGRSGVTVLLVNAAGATVKSGQTNAFGIINFTDVAPDTYRLRVQPPSSLKVTLRDRGNDDLADNDADPASNQTDLFALAPGDLAESWDIGLAQRAFLNGTVYRDANQNLQSDSGEPTVAGLTVYADLDNDAQVDPGEPTAVTSSSGTYALEVNPGTSVVRVAPSAIWTFPAAGAQSVFIPGEGTLSGIALPVWPAVATLPVVSPVGGEFRPNEATDGDQSQPSIGIDASGNMVAAWTSLSTTAGAAKQVIVRRFSAAGAAPGGDVIASTATSAPAATTGALPRVAVAPDGSFFVAWIGAGAVYGRRFDAAGAPLGDAFTVSETAGTAARGGLRVAVDPTGGYAVAWDGSAPGDDTGVAARRYGASGTPKGGEFRVNEITTNAQTLGGLAFDAGGRLLVAYTSVQQDGSGDGTFGRWFASTDGGPEGPSFQVNVTTTGNQTAGAVAVDAATGRAMFLFLDAASQVYGRVYEADGTPRTGEFRVDASPSPTPSFATRGRLDLAAGPDGTFFAVWVSTDGAADGVFAQLVNADGVPLGREIRVNTEIADVQAWPAMASGPGGSYTVAWSSLKEDGSGDGIYAQRYVQHTARSSVRGVTWTDINGDGIHDPFEPLAFNVTVALLNSAGNVVDVTSSGGAGSYLFDLLRPGDAYRVLFSVPFGSFVAPADQGPDDSVDSDVDPATNTTANFTAAADGLTATPLDLGLMPAATLKGTVFFDANDDRVFSGGGDQGLAGWQVFLDTDGDGQLDSGEPSTLTSVTGGFTITPLRSGPYRVGVVPLTHWMLTSTAASLQTTLSAGQTNTVDVALRPINSLAPRATPVGPETRVNTTTAGDQRWSTVDADAAGNYMVVWTDSTFLRGQRYAADGTPLGTEFTIGTGPASSPPVTPSVAASDDGRFVVTWSMDGDVYARRYDAAGAPVDAAPWRVNTTTANFQYNPDVAVRRADGSFVIVWQSGPGQDGSGQGVYGQRFAADGTPLGTEFLASGSTASDQTTPKVAVDGSGNFVVSYLSTHQFAARVYFQRFDVSGQVVQGETRASDLTRGDGFSWNDVAMNAAGEFVIAFRGFDGDRDGIEFRRYDAQGVAQGTQLIANTTTANSQDVSSVRMTDDGRFVVVWHSYGEAAEGGSLGARAQWFDASGAKLGPEIRVNTTTAGDQYDTDVAFLPQGMVLTWVGGNANGGANSDVYAQRYRFVANPGTLGGVAFEDANGNGVRDGGEAGEDGVAVQLLNDANAVAGTATTANGGTFRFDVIDPAMTYRLRFVGPPGTIFTARDVGADDTVDSDVDPSTGLTGTITVAAGQADLTVGAGLLKLASISGRVYQDDDGVRGPLERTSAGWTVYADANGNGLFDAGEPNSVTDATGSYKLSDLRPDVQQRLEVLPRTRWALTTSITQRLLKPAQGQATTLDLGVAPTGTAVPVTPQPEVTLGVGPQDFTRHKDWFAIDPQGGAVAVGDVSRLPPGTNGVDVIGQVYLPSGTPRSPQFILSTTTAFDQNAPSVARAADGTFVAVWRYDGVQARRFTADGAPMGPEIKIADGETPRVAMEPDGDFVVAYYNGVGVFARQYSADLTPRGPAFKVSTQTQGEQSGPDVAVNADGDFAVLWRNGSGLYVRRYDPAGNPIPGVYETAPFGTAFIDSADPDWQTYAAVSLNATGEMAIAWAGAGVSNGAISLALFDSSGAMEGGPIMVDAGGSPLPRFPDVALRDDGSTVVVWQGPDGSSDGIFMRQFSGSGLPSGDATRVNGDSAGRQWDAKVALLPDGGFVVGWADVSGGSRARRFDAQPVSYHSSAGGFVWDDADANGRLDAGEAPVAGVSVDLLSSNASVATTVTGADGSFRFGGLTPGSTYAFRYAVPPGKVATQANQGTDDLIDSDADASAQTAFTAPSMSNGLDLSYGLGLVRSAAAPSVASTKVDDGAAQRSQVRSLTVTFDRPVTLAAGALRLELLNSGGSGADDGSAPTDASSVLTTPVTADGGMTWTVSFAPPFAGGSSPFLQSTVGGTGSLADGIYRLTVVAAKVSSVGGAMVGDVSMTFHRLFGDVNGNKGVNTLDYGLFRSAFGKSAGQAGFDPAFDFDGNGVINTLDYGQFRGRFGKSFNY